MPPTPTRKRAPAACEFCRRRKIKCDNAQPICRNCEAYDKTCNYVEGEKRPRPSNSRIAELEAENRRLHDALSSTTPRPDARLADVTPSNFIPSSRRQSPEPSDEQSAAAALTEIGRHSAVSRISYSSPNGQSSYHGPTSALYDDAGGFRKPNNTHTRAKIPAEWVQKGLMAEAAQQRQMEAINYSSGRLDFDGVDPELGMHLLSLHWSRQHHSFLITYRPAFMRDMAQSGPYFSKLLLNAIFFGVSKFSPRTDIRSDPNDVRTAGWRFRRRVRELLGEEMDKSKVTTIQALLVMSSSLFALGDERSAAWLYAGTAFRMITDLGMHVDATLLPDLRSLSDEDLEIRRRVFWGAFVVDKLQSLYQGRPVSLQESDTRVPMTFLDLYEELEYWQPYTLTGAQAQAYQGSPTYSVSTFTQFCKLSVIMNRILNKVYTERSTRRSMVDLLHDLRSLQHSLDRWKQDLPEHLRFDLSTNSSVSIPPPNVLSILTIHNVLLILLHRPFVADGHLHSKPSDVAVSSFLVCAAAATEITSILRAYDRAFSFRRAPYLMSYATYVGATIHVRIAAQREGRSEAHACLATCLEMLKANENTNWAIRKASLVIRDLMTRMKVEVQDSIPIANNESRLEHPSSYAQIVQPTQEELNHQDNDYPDLDIEQIIQSFMQHQPIPPPFAQAGSAPPYPDTPTSHPTVPSEYPYNLEAGHSDQAFNDGFGYDLNEFSNGHTTSDMLFGFHGSLMDMTGFTNV